MFMSHCKAMKQNQVCRSLTVSLLHLCVTANVFLHCDARKSMGFSRAAETPKTLNAIKHTFLEQMMTQLNLAEPLGSSNTQPYGVSSPFSLPPYNSLPPATLPENSPPPLCLNPTTPGPTTTVPNPPGPVSGSSGPKFGPSPPGPTFESSPPGPIVGPNPPGSTFGLSPPGNPSPRFSPSPTSPALGMPRNKPSPPVFLPPIVFPPPTARQAPPRGGEKTALWCVAKPSVPDPIMQEAMNYACGSGGDCGSVQPDGPCYKPDTLFAHASFAFNSYWQRTKAAGGSCEFGGTGMLVTVDPSYNGCRFDYF